ncbi:MAG: TylF/MycF/NovP-related O-methyltransferase [Verrucomicrobiia bacterium]
MNAAVKSLQRLWQLRLKPALSIHESLLTDLTDQNLAIIRKVRSFTMTSALRLNALIDAVRYLETNNISGAIVECGVWRGGSMMAVIETLKELGQNKRALYLFDTYEGMPEPQAQDTSPFHESTEEIFNQMKRPEGGSNWCYSSLETTKQNVLSTGYDKTKIHFIKGKVEDTLPQLMPSSEIALLRLDTDFYSSTRHELIHLFPRLVSGGVLILDDYGHWEGQKLAVEEYFNENKISMLLNRIDYTGRIGIKR